MANAVGPNGYDGGGGGGGGGSGRPPRLPRWTRQEILVLIQGKKVVEGRGGRGGGRAAGAEGGGRQQLEPKWAAVAGYCRRHGVDRGPVQCRKRWSNLAGDYKKIKEWERARGGGGDKGESFWAMRNDLRRERRLPGFFDREVYDILDGVAAVAAASGEEIEEEEEEEEEAAEKKRRRRRKKKEEEAAAEEEEEAVFDSGRTAAEDRLFSDSEEEEAVAVAVTITAAAARGGEEAEERSALPPTTATAAAAVPVVVMPISEKKYEVPYQESNEPAGTSKDKQPAHDTENEGHKRKRPSSEEAGETNIESQLVDVLERNSRMLSAQLEAQNLNSQLDREQRKDQTNSLLVILNKLADALGKIADKL